MARDHTRNYTTLTDTTDLARLEEHVAAGALEGPMPWDRLHVWGERTLSIKGQEQLVSLMMEPYGALVDDLAEAMGTDEGTAFGIDGAMPIDRLREIVADVHGWALALDWTSPDTLARVWYVSEEKLEPRLGERLHEPIEPYEQPLAPGHDAAALDRDLRAWGGEPIVAAFLLAHPEHRHLAAVARRSRPPLPLRRDPRQHDLGRAPADRSAARQARLLRGIPLRPALGPLSAHQHAPRRAVPARVGHQRPRRLDLPVPAGGRGVTFSLGEIETAGRRAARGAGLSWGLAEEAGHAARWLCAQGLPGAEMLTRDDGACYDSLAPVRVEGVWAARSGPLCPLIAGAALCDRAADLAAGREIALKSTSHPLLLAPFVAGAAALAGTTLRLRWPDASMTIGPDWIAVDGVEEMALRTRSAARVSCRLADDAPAARSRRDADRPVDAETWSRLGAFAPASEVSRLAGAGARLSDND